VRRRFLILNFSRLLSRPVREFRYILYAICHRLRFSLCLLRRACEDDSVKQHLVLYDGECPLCRFQMRVLTWLDWFGVLALVPLSDPRAAETGISREALDEQMHCVTKDGRVYRGARCIRFVGMRLPLLVPLALLLWVPGVIWIAEHVYAWVSRNRYRLGKIFGCKGACAIMPARKREQDKVV
jgi:predicted DCC family thiol-disulfide oxidoreductase YuxK